LIIWGVGREILFYAIVGGFVLGFLFFFFLNKKEAKNQENEIYPAMVCATHSHTFWLKQPLAVCPSSGLRASRNEVFRFGCGC
jgi:hypothetical protein